jgi:hypothetical protein
MEIQYFCLLSASLQGMIVLIGNAVGADALCNMGAEGRHASLASPMPM